MSSWLTIKRVEVVFARAWDVEARWPGFWKALAIVVAASFTLWQYFVLQREAATARTMEYIKRYEDGRVADARRGISAKLRPFMPSLERLQNLDEKGRVKILYAIQDLNPEIAEDIDTVVDFFEGLKICIHEKLCRRGVAVAYFGRSEVRDFWNNFKPYISDRQKNNSNYANGIEWFLTNSEMVK